MRHQLPGRLSSSGKGSNRLSQAPESESGFKQASERSNVLHDCEASIADGKQVKSASGKPWIGDVPTSTIDRSGTGARIAFMARAIAPCKKYPWGAPNSKAGYTCAVVPIANNEKCLQTGKSPYTPIDGRSTHDRPALLPPVALVVIAIRRHAVKATGIDIDATTAGKEAFHRQ